MTSLPNTPAVATTHRVIRTTNTLQEGKLIGYYEPDSGNARYHGVYNRLKQVTAYLREQEVIGIEKKDRNWRLKTVDNERRYDLLSRAFQRMSAGIRLLYTSEGRRIQQIFNTVMTPLFQRHAKVDVTAIAVLPTPVLWFV